MEDKRIIVAGAGHGGLTAAARLAANGYDVTVFEAQGKRNLGYDWYDSATLKAMQNAGLGDKITENDLTSMKRMCYYIASAVTPVYQREAEDGQYSPQIERRLLLKKLIELASENGAKLRFNTRVLEPIIEDGRVVGVVTDKGKSRADLVIDAAGVDSPLRSQLPEELGVDNTYAPGEVLYAYRGLFNKNDSYAEPVAAHETFIYLFGTRGLSWCVTEENHVDMLIGCFGPIDMEYVNEMLESFRIRRPQLGSTLLRGGRIAKIPTRRPLAQFVCNGYAAVGDSAYMTMPMNGSGIVYSLNAGVLLADCIMADSEGEFTAESLWSYNREYIKTVGAAQAATDILKNVMLGFEPDELDFLLSKRIITENDLASCGTATTTADMLGRVARGFRQLPVLVKLAGALTKGESAKSIYLEIPEKYNREAVDEWKKRVAKTIIPLEPNN